MFLAYNYQGLLWALFILILSGLPGSQFEKSKLEHADSVIHLVLYGFLFFFLAVGFLKQTQFSWLRSATLRKVFVICVGYGVAVEILQATVFIERTIELSDMLFNALGSAVGAGIFIGIYGAKGYL